MNPNYEIDNLDLQILAALSKDGRRSFLELSRKFNVSAGTIHVRTEKLKAAGIIEGAKIQINTKKLGLDVTCFIGIILHRAGDYQKIIKHLEKFNEVIEAYYTTGKYSLFIKVTTKNMESLYNFMIDKLQSINEIQATETFIVLQTAIHKDAIAAI